MVILALETATRAGSMALWTDGTCAACLGDPSRPHGERLPGEILEWLNRHGKAPGDIDLLAVVSGPGSFTGLRVGMATMQGMALAGHRRVLGVPTLDALAETWLPAADGHILLVPCLDGQRGDVFFAAFEVDGPQAIEQCARALPASVGRPAEAAAAIAVRAAGRRVVLVGDGTVRYRDVFAAALPDAELVDAPRPIAAAAAGMAARHPDRAGAPHALQPIYVRRPDAVLARERAGRAAAANGAPAGCTIHRAEGPADLQAVEVLQRQTFTNPWAAEAMRWELENTDVARLYVMHEPGGRLVAYCACWLVFDELHINSFAVDPERRRRGLARALLRHVLQEGVHEGARSATLEVRGSNVAARALYERLGFQVEGTRRDYYQDPREDALILWNRSLR